MPSGYKYSVSAMCKVLHVPRSTSYYESKPKKGETQLVTDIIEIFRRSRNNYRVPVPSEGKVSSFDGQLTGKIKLELKKLRQIVSHRRICRIMKQEGLIPNYTVAQFKPHTAKCNEDEVSNIVNCQFNQQPHLKVVVSDLTYIRVGNRWHYLCALVNLFNRETIGYSSGPNKDTALVKKAFSTININPNQIKIFRTDCGNEFKNQVIDEILEAFNIKRSLSMKGCPYDNAVAEATYKIIKIEFVNQHLFETQEQLVYEFADYIKWYNNHRIHSSLGYMSPVEYRQNTLKKSCLV